MEQVKDWRFWLNGLIAAIVNGAASGVVLIIAEPQHFNLQAGLPKLASTSALLGLLGAANYLKNSPVPGWDGTERRGQ
jgi:hypothetical protein